MRKLMVAQELNDILVVDDTPQNLHLLVDILTKYDYKVRPVPNGKLALAAAEINPPHLILLDIMMPDLDGYQVCKELKSNPKTKNIPIIFISAVDESVDKVKAFAVGGVDYITKPFQMHEVLIRVKHQLSLVSLKQQLKAKNNQLTLTINQLKKNQKKALKSHKNLVLEKITSGISHQVNDPLAELQGSLAELRQFSESSLKSLSVFLQQISPEQQKYLTALLKQAETRNIGSLLSIEEKQQLKSKITTKLDNFALEETEKIANLLVELGADEEIEEFLPLLTGKNYLEILENAYLIHHLPESMGHISDSARKLTTITDALNHYASSQNNSTKLKKRQAHLPNTIERALITCFQEITSGIQIVKNYTDVPVIDCYPEELQEIWVHLIQNAIDAVGSLGIITINVYQQQNNLVVDIIDTGDGIDPAIVSKMCDPFFTTKSPGKNTGLGLTIAKQLIELHEGSIAVNIIPGKTTLPGKTKFTVSLPLSLKSEITPPYHKGIT